MFIVNIDSWQRNEKNILRTGLHIEKHESDDPEKGIPQSYGHSFEPVNQNLSQAGTLDSGDQACERRTREILS